MRLPAPTSTTWLVGILLAIGRYDDARAIILDNSEFDEFRSILIDEAVNKGDYEKAERLILEGINFEHERGYWGIVNRLEDQLLEITKKSKSIEAYRELAKRYFFARDFELASYKKWKKTYSKEEWLPIYETTVQEIAAKENVYEQDVYHLGEIYIEEKDWTRLFKLTKTNSQRLSIVNNYAPYLKKDYPAELLKFYQHGIEKMATQTGRSVYREIAANLNRMKKIKDGESAAKFVARALVRKYANRPAMRDELSKFLH